MPLWLVGMMGSGKSAVGRLVASRLDVPLVDTDERIVQEAAEPIERLWAHLGEESFRDLEQAEVARLSRENNVVVATGGGAVLREANRSVMRASGLVVWLRADPASLAVRVGNKQGRPLLAGGAGLVERLEDMLGSRRSHYLAAAHHVVDTDGRTVEAVADEVVGLWSAS